MQNIFLKDELLIYMSMVNVSDNPRMALYSVLSCICILTLHMIVHLIVHFTGSASGSQDITAEDCIKIGKGQLSLTLVHVIIDACPHGSSCCPPQAFDWQLSSLRYDVQGKFA